MRLKLLVVVAAILVAASLCLLAEGFVDATLALVLVLEFFIGTVMAVGWVWRPEPNVPLICDPFVLSCVFFGQFYVIGAIILVSGGGAVYPFQRAYDPVRPIQVLFAFLLMMVMFQVGYHLRLGKTLSEMLPDFSRFGRKMPGLWYETALLVGALGGTYGWIDYQGGLMAKLAKPYWQKPGSAPFLVSHNALVAATLLVAWRVMRRERTRFVHWVPLIALSAFDLVFFGVVLGARKYLFYLFFGMLAIYTLRHGYRALPKFRVAMIALALLLFFSAWGVLRSTSVLDLVQGSRSTAPPAEEQSLRSGYLVSVSEPFLAACIIFDVFPTAEPFRLGSTLDVTLYFFIPRAIWEDKPTSIAKDITKYIVGPYYEPVYGYSATPTIPADLYLNFGWFGIVLGGMALGILCRIVASYMTKDMRNGLQLTTARVLLPAGVLMGLVELRADMAALLAFLILTVGPLLFGLMIARFDETVEEPSPS